MVGMIVGWVRVGMACSPFLPAPFLVRSAARVLYGIYVAGDRRQVDEHAARVPRRHAGETTHVAHQMRLVVVAEPGRELGPRAAPAAAQMAHERVEANDARQQLGRDADVIAEQVDGVLVAVTELARQRAD